ncbi:MAG TPA: hypothetical protein DCL86_07900 [Bacteroidales bacterium]|jgi:hypothetical protein|nr:hypothetical protein [Bacteroidales bacterium]
MRNLIFILALLAAGNAYSNSIDTIKVETTIPDVTVFLNGAQISRQANLNIPKGKHLLLIGRLPQGLNPQSIQMNEIADCKTLSVKHQLEYNNDRVKGKQELSVESQIKDKELKIKEIKNKVSVFEIEEKILLDNSKLGKPGEGSPVSEIKAAADFYRLRLNEIRQSKLVLLNELEQINEEIQKLYTGLNKLITEKRKTYSQLLIVVECEKAVSAKLSFSYYISSAGWEPMYDFRVDEVNKPLSIVYNANVFQSSGEDWNNVKVKLSTSNPSLSGEVPQLEPWYLGRWYAPALSKTAPGASTLKGGVFDAETNEAIPFVNVIVETGGRQVAGTASDFDGRYTIKPLAPGVYDVRATFVGYQPIVISGVVVRPNQITFSDIRMKPAAINIESYEVADYMVPLMDKEKRAVGATVTSQEMRKLSGRAAGVDVTGSRHNMDAVTTNFLSNSLKSTVVNLEYVIDMPYTILSDGEDYSIRIKEVSLPGNYVYHAVPKLENDVFLTAEIPDWEALNLLSGKTSIYYQGTFTGESAIDAEQASDTLSISLGRDHNVLVSREGNKKLMDKRIIGSNYKEVVGWDITVKNNRNSKIKIVVEDQFPVSERKSIVVEQRTADGAKVDEKTGKITWELELNPGEKKVLTYSYSVKYPKTDQLILD